MDWIKRDLQTIDISDVDLNTCSQLELARAIMDKKRYVLQDDFQTTLEGYTFDTVGCETEMDFLNKYQEQLNDMGISPFSVNKVLDDNGNTNYLINVDLTDYTKYANDFLNDSQKPLSENVTLSTANCDSISDFRVANQENLDKLSSEVVEQIIDHVAQYFQKEDTLPSDPISVDSEVSNEDITKVSEDLNPAVTDENLIEEQNKLQQQLAIIESYENGTLNRYQSRTDDRVHSEPFNLRIEKINEQIKELEDSLENSADQSDKDAIGEFTQARLKLEAISFSTEQESKAIQVYYIATAFPDVENIIKALETACALPDSSKMKEPLIDTIVKLSARYASQKDEEEKQAIQDAISRLNIQTVDNKNVAIQNQIDDLKSQLVAIENQRQLRINEMKPIKQSIQEKLAQLTITPSQKVDSTDNEFDLVPEEEKKNVREQEFNQYLDKLTDIANEGPIFNDRSKIRPQDDWMEINTAKALNRYDNLEHDNIQVSDNVSANVNTEANIPQETVIDHSENHSEDYFDLPVTEDSLKLPHPIKAIKKASANLISKIYNIDFKKYKNAFVEKIKSALNVMKQNKVATTVGLLAAGIMIASSLGKDTTLSNSVTNTPNIESEKFIARGDDHTGTDSMENSDNLTDQYITSDQSVDQTEVSTGSSSIENEMSEDELFQQNLQQTLNQILDGKTKVYISADRAAQDVNGQLPSASQLENSWQNATPGAYYNVENGAIHQMSEQEAKDYWQDGGQVVVSMNHNGTPIGYTTMEQEVGNPTSGITK